MTQEERDALDIVTFSDDEGNSFDLQVVNYFFYNGEEYASLKDAAEDEQDSDALYIMKINSFVDENGEEMDEFVPPADDLLDTLLESARTQFDEQE